MGSRSRADSKSPSASHAPRASMMSLTMRPYLFNKVGLARHNANKVGFPRRMWRGNPTLETCRLLTAEFLQLRAHVGVVHADAHKSGQADD